MFVGLLNAIAASGAISSDFNDAPQALAIAGTGTSTNSAVLRPAATAGRRFLQRLSPLARAITLYTMGINQSASGSDKCYHQRSPGERKFGRRAAGIFR